MAIGPHETLDDPALAGGEWLFRRRGEVFGPVDSRTLAAMLYRGDIDPGTPVSSGNGAWRPVGEISAFVIHARKAEAALRVEREVTGARQLRQRKTRRKNVALLTGAVLLVAGGVAAGVAFAPRTSVSGLTEDFGGGISVVSRAQVGLSGRAPEDEIEIPLDPAPGGAPAAAAGPFRRERPAARPTAAGSVAGGDELVEQRFDPARIEAVVAREQRTLVPCFREEAARTPEFEGDVPLEFAVGNDGRVAALWIDDPRFKGGALEGCITRALAAWRFEPFPGQRPTVKLAFRMGK
jgi:hypothetical protein